MKNEFLNGDEDDGGSSVTCQLFFPYFCSVKEIVMGAKTSRLRKAIPYLEEKKSLCRFENFKFKYRQGMKAVYPS